MIKRHFRLCHGHTHARFFIMGFLVKSGSPAVNVERFPKFVGYMISKGG